MPIHIDNSNCMIRLILIMALICAPSAAQAQITFSSGDLQKKTAELTGDASAWPILLSFAQRNVTLNTFSLSKEGMEQVKKFAALHKRIQSGKKNFHQLLKAGARVFAPDELQKSTSLGVAYDNLVREGNYTELTRIGEEYLQSLEEIRKTIERKRNEEIDALLAERNGDVTKRKGFLGEWKQALKGDMLQRADGLRTGMESFAQLAFTDGVEVVVDPNSTVVIRESTMDRLDQRVRRDIALVKGSLLTKLTESAKERNNFTFQAGTSESQVRSGKFWASAVEERRVKLSNYDGTMDVSANRGTVRLKTNEGTVVEKGKEPLPPVQLLAAPMLAWNGIDSVIYSDNIVLRWNTIPASTGYKVELCKSKDFNADIRIITSSLPAARLNNIDLGIVYIRLTAVDQYGLRGMESPMYKLMRVEDKLPPAIYVDNWVSDRRYTALKNITITGSTEPDAHFTMNGTLLALDNNGMFSTTVPVEQSEKLLTFRSTDRSGNVRDRTLTLIPIDTNNVTTIEWNCPVNENVLAPVTKEISARGTAYPSMKITAIHGDLRSTVQTDSQGNWAMSVVIANKSPLTLVFESISDNIVVASKTFTIE